MQRLQNEELKSVEAVEPMLMYGPNLGFALLLFIFTPFMTWVVLNYLNFSWLTDNLKGTVAFILSVVLVIWYIRSEANSIRFVRRSRR